MNLKFEKSLLLVFLLALMPFATLPKIITGFDLFPLILDSLLLFLVIVFFIDGKDSKLNSHFIYFLFLFLISLLYFFYSRIDGLYNQFTAFRLTAFYMIIFFLPFYMKLNESALERIYNCLVIISVVIALNGIRQWIYPFSFEVDFANSAGGAAKFYGDYYAVDDNAFRIFSTFSTSVHLVIFLTLANFLSISKAIVSKKITRIEALNLMTSSICIILTFSRSGWVAFFIGLLSLFFFTINRRNFFHIVFLVFVILSLVLIFYNSSYLFEQRLNTLFDIGNVNSLSTREMLWDRRITDLVNNPLGYGTGAASWNIHWQMKLGADSNYLKFLLEYGVVFGSFFILFLIISTFTIFTKVRVLLKREVYSEKPEFRLIFLFAILAFLLSIFVQMYTNQVLEAYPSNAFYWLFLGMGLRLCKN